MESPIRLAALAGVAPIKPDTSKAADASKTNFFTEATPLLKKQTSMTRKERKTQIARTEAHSNSRPHANSD